MQIPKSSMLIAVAVLFTAQVAAGAEPPTPGELPEPVQRGLSAFKTNGGQAAVKNWTRRGPLESTEIEKTKINAAEKLEKLYGRYQGFSVVEQIELSPVSQLIYLEIQLEKGPIYVKLQVYTGTYGVRVVALHLDPRPEELLPPYTLENKSQSRGGINP